ncbi:insulinase family protein [Asticcacaulis sp. EMRT-3]|uniref:M16 family metallopeptidase n=1 Tax=Asticcacaulis sp. EMRT-3 TaxID=3040349 RepID=UPI0024AF6AF6|nr:insulinase family protein [Asticcacaulis sp. EMRT-3]MDI7774152.1 insulinase family protein [Asticcacaulis sp. EMRT-3]
MLLKKSLLSAFLAAALTSTALTPVASFAQAQPAATATAAFTPQVRDLSKGLDFPQNHSDIKADPNVRFGKLPNGLTYIIMKNDTPPGNASIRLRINGGSMMEHDDQQGLAHFLEHMAFNGSKNVAEGDMVKILERHGLAFGADTNAHTGFDETVYELDLPTVKPDDIDTGLFLMRETAGNLTLDDGAIDRERNVILGEERARDTPSLHAYEHWADDALPGQKYAERMPIGKVDIIQTAKHPRFEDFYRNFYRPKLATLIVVGDIDPNTIEADIKAKFSDWKGPDAPIRMTDFGTYKNKGVTADTYVEKGLRDTISLTWTWPFDDHYQDVAKETKDFINGLRLQILNERLERQAKLADTPFIAAQVGHDDIGETATLTQLTIIPKPGHDKEALTAATTMVRQFAQFGVTQDELDRALADQEAGFKAALQGAKTRDSRNLADQLADSMADGEVFTSPQQDYDYFEALKPRLTLSAVNAGTKDLFDGDGPFLWHEGEDLDGLDKQALLDTWQAVQAAPLSAPQIHVAKPWPYTDFGQPAAIVKREEIKDLGLTQLTYANGLKATIKTTDFKQDEIGVTVRFAGGLASLSPAAHPPVFAANVDDIQEGGLGKLTASQIKDTLSGKIYGVQFGFGADAATLSGATTKSDFATQMQVLMAFTTDAAFRADAFQRLKGFIPDYYKSLQSTPGGVFQMKVPGILHSGDPRFTMPDESSFLATSNDQVKALVEHQLQTAPVEITIVGDVSEAEAESEIAKTFAALSARPAQPVIAPDGLKVRFPDTDLRRTFEHHGRADQDLSFIAWPGADFASNTRRARGLTMLSEVLNLRLIDIVREKEQLAYSPYAGNINSQTFPGYGYLSVTAEVKPQNDQKFYDAVAAIVADLKAHPITPDELLRAQKPVLDKMDTELKTNSYWETVLPGTASDPKKLDYIRDRRAQYQAVTAADIQKLAQTYLNMDKALRLQIKPAADAQATDPAPSASPTS